MRVLAEHAEELPEPGVDRADALGTCPKQHPREAAGGGAEVERHPPRHRHVETSERRSELRFSAQLPFADEADRRPGPDERSRVVDDAAVDRDAPRQNRLRGAVEPRIRLCNDLDEPAQPLTTLAGHREPPFWVPDRGQVLERRRSRAEGGAWPLSGLLDEAGHGAERTVAA